MKRNLILIIGIFLLFVGILTAGSLITIGEKLSQITGFAHAEHIFYALILGLLAYLILAPMVRIHRAKVFPALSVDGTFDAVQLQALGKSLSANCRYIPDKRMRMRHEAELSVALSKCGKQTDALEAVLKEEIDLRFNGSEALNVVGINRRITEWAKSVFMISAVSQNSKFDALSILYLNYKMIEDLILASGFRPDNRQLFRMYASILTTALVTYCLSEALRTGGGSIAPFDLGDFNEQPDADDIARSATEANLDLPDLDDSASGYDLGDQLSDSDDFSIYSILRRIRIPSVVLSSAIDGSLNALMTLRIGYITRTYLQQGRQALSGMANKRAVKRQAMKDAVVALPAIVASGSHLIGKKATQMILKLIKRPHKRENGKEIKAGSWPFPMPH